MNSSAIVLSAGSGTRMGLDIPKQYMPLLGKPVLYYTLKAFQESDVNEIIIVCGAGDEDFVRETIVEEFGFDKVIAIVPGGENRYDSVYAGLSCVRGEYVLIHDGARCFVDQDIIANALEELASHDACVVGMPVKDTIKQVDARGCVVDTPSRSSLWLVQTPQCFRTSLAQTSYKKMYQAKEEGLDISHVTDDAMVIESFSNVSVKMIAGDYNNIKITTPEDVILGETILKSRGLDKL